jgi:hypothetical protein
MGACAVVYVLEPIPSTVVSDKEVRNPPTDEKNAGSGKITDEGFDYLGGNPTVNLPHDCTDAPSLDYIGGTFAERYRKGRAAPHVHLRVGLRGVRALADYCATLTAASRF